MITATMGGTNPSARRLSRMVGVGISATYHCPVKDAGGLLLARWSDIQASVAGKRVTPINHQYYTKRNLRHQPSREHLAFRQPTAALEHSA